MKKKHSCEELLLYAYQIHFILWESPLTERNIKVTHKGEMVPHPASGEEGWFRPPSQQGCYWMQCVHHKC